MSELIREKKKKKKKRRKKRVGRYGSRERERDIEEISRRSLHLFSHHLCVILRGWCTVREKNSSPPVLQPSSVTQRTSAANRSSGGAAAPSVPTHTCKSHVRPAKTRRDGRDGVAGCDGGPVFADLFLFFFFFPFFFSPPPLLLCRLML